MTSPLTLFFDLDGTLTDPGVGITRCLRYAMERMGGPVEETSAYARFIGPPLQGTFAELLGPGRAHLVDDAVAAYRERFGREGMWENERYDGVDEALALLREWGHQLFVTTSKPTYYARPIVERFGLLPHFHEVYGAEMDGTRASKRDLLAHVLDREGLDPDRVIMVGDRGVDMEGAAANGIRGIGATYGYGSREELEAAGAAALVGSPGTLPRAIQSL